MPLKRMIEECRKRGVLVLIDGAHAPGQIEINLEELCPDFYVGNFHKWVYTPRGCAFLWVHKDHQNWCTPLVTSYMYDKGFQLEYGQQGTRDDTPYFLIPDAIQFYKDMGGRVSTVNKLLFAATLFRDLLEINWLATTNFSDQTFSRPIYTTILK